MLTMQTRPKSAEIVRQTHVEKESAAAPDTPQKALSGKTTGLVRTANAPEPRPSKFSGEVSSALELRGTGVNPPPNSKSAFALHVANVTIRAWSAGGYVRDRTRGA